MGYLDDKVLIYIASLIRTKIMTKYNCTATVELELRGRLCVISAYGLAISYPATRIDPEESDMDIVALENDRGRPISARLEALIDSEQWDAIEQALWDYEP